MRQHGQRALGATLLLVAGQGCGGTVVFAEDRDDGAGGADASVSSTVSSGEAVTGGHDPGLPSGAGGGGGAPEPAEVCGGVTCSPTETCESCGPGPRAEERCVAPLPMPRAEEFPCGLGTCQLDAGVCEQSGPCRLDAVCRPLDDVGGCTSCDCLRAWYEANGEGLCAAGGSKNNLGELAVELAPCPTDERRDG